MEISVIGNGNQSKKIQNILKKKKLNFFLYKPNNSSYYEKKDFTKVIKSKIVFILSPNNTHFYYLNKLKNHYIFCEKPPVNNLRDLKKLQKFSYKKIYFNFNHRFSKVSEVLMNISRYKLGKIIHGEIVSSYGLALKKLYKYNWRSDISKNPKGTFETVSIHWIDLINFHFKIKDISKPILSNHSKIGNSYDTSNVTVKLNNNALVNITSSYFAPYSKRIFLLFENGIIEQINEKLTIYGPAENYDKNGRFIPPKIIKKFNVNESNDYNKSNINSVNFFINNCKNNIYFKKNLFTCSIKTNELLF